jgi:hypothetical protein
MSKSLPFCVAESETLSAYQHLFVTMVTTTSSVVVPVDPHHRLDEARLLQYLQASIPGFLPPPATLHVLQVFFHPEYSILCSFTLNVH